MSNTENEESIDLFKQALEATADGVVITHGNGNILWVNHAYERLTGYSLSEVKGVNPRILKSGKQDPVFYKDLWSTISSGKVWNGELWNKRKDHSLYLEEQSITPVLNESGAVTHYIAIKRDVTNQFQLQNQLNKAQRIEAIGNLTAGVAHNFNNKLASILGYAELANEEVQQYSNEELIDYLNEIMVAGKLARDLVRQMMSFSRNDIHEIKSVQLSEVIKSTVKILSSTLPSSVKILTQLHDVPDVSVDPVRMHQMILSLAVNSSDAMDGKGVIIIGVYEESVKSEMCNSCHETFYGDYVVLTVQDTGKGISSEDIEKIFLPFFTTRQNEGGTGMGLSALHGMIHDQKGHVQVESTLGQSTELKLYLPVAHTATGNIEVNTEESQNAIDKNVKEHISIMVVDDEASVANVLAEILRHYGYYIEVETNSKSALIKFSENPSKYDLLITDKEMPHLDGIELSRLVSDINKSVPVLLMSGHSSEKDEHYSENIKTVLTKPFETTELIEVIKNIIL
ncbi:MAG: hypothetical protein DIZ80_01885 [endosymbiont of Galathealinum brachiosum]|uniref:histidine kinase n=1 Tax=endosymbiont of Galathealinum brachiosum TaxID=2200906 RepID=A0A370DMA3_9GAMM|nr:MAG: hypothetical protein DIZ80_01885 [endosymbiont of Galathealinum brachiosum]